MAKAPQRIEERVRRLRKDMAASLEAVERAITNSRGTYDDRASVKGISGYAVRVVVRVKSPHPQSWAMAILLNNERVDGIDWEQRVADHRGKQHDCSGWHRHVWKLQGRDTNKECLQGFAPSSAREFLRLGFSVLNVHLKKEVKGAERKLFDD